MSPQRAFAVVLHVPLVMGNLLPWHRPNVKTIYYHGNTLSDCFILKKVCRLYDGVEGVPNIIWRNQKSVGRVELKVVALVLLKASRRMRSSGSRTTYLLHR